MGKSHSHHHHNLHHGASHSHAHGHHHGHQVVSNVRFAFILNFTFSILEFIGGAWIGSMAIMANAMHDLGDSISLGIAWLMERYANRSHDKKFNFGYRRFSLLSALLSGFVISIGSAIIIYESLERFQQPKVPPSGIAVSLLAALGIFINGLAAWRLSRGVTQNERVLTWHSVEDMMSWVAVLVGGVIIAVFRVDWIDPVLAIGLSVFVMFNVLRYLKQTTYLFLQGRPGNFDEESFLNDVLAISGIEKVDNIAVWSLDGKTNILNARLHVHSLNDPIEIEKAKAQVRQIAIHHGAIATLETCLAEQGHD